LAWLTVPSGLVHQVQSSAGMKLGTTLTMHPVPARRRLHKLRIRVADGPDTGNEVISDGQELSVGTAPDNDLALTDPTVSRHHFSVRCTERGYWVRDLGSTNGIKMGPHLVQSAVVSDGCELAIGTTRLVFELLEDVISVPAVAEPKWSALLTDYCCSTASADVAPSEPADTTEPVAGQPVVTDEFDPTLSFRDAKERAVGRWERWYVAELLRHTRGNLSEAARVSHSDRSHLRKLVRKHLHRTPSDAESAADPGEL
jgi:pSer/pThr/pTyr-binding forkhead associated (FHA) protein